MIGIYRQIEQALRSQWSLGREIILCWTPRKNGMDFLTVPYYLIGTLISEEQVPETTEPIGSNDDVDGINIHEVMQGARYVSNALMKRIEKSYGITRHKIEFRPPAHAREFNTEKIDELVRRYSISYVRNHAVALFDIVGFSKYTPIDQVTLLSSLSYSINSAYNKLQRHDIEVGFERTSTGDGYYIWSNEPTIESNINLYNLVQLILADNAIARTKTYGHTAPTLKTAFHIGNYYEFHQSEALKPTPYNYIVGDVTIELARIIEKAMPGQILVGDFNCHLPSPDNPDTYINVDTIDFIEILKEKVRGLKGVLISDKEIESIVCYLTGERVGEDKFTISRYKIVDKHERFRTVFNAKVNIYRDKYPPIFLGIQEKDVHISSSIMRV